MTVFAVGARLAAAAKTPKKNRISFLSLSDFCSCSAFFSPSNFSFSPRTESCVYSVFKSCFTEAPAVTLHLQAVVLRNAAALHGAAAAGHSGFQGGNNATFNTMNEYVLSPSADN